MATTFTQAQRPNGLDVIAEVDPDAHSAAIGFFVKTGARDERPALMGVSHFLEHMIFKGTETRTAADVDRDFDQIGATHNAFTTSEMTAFWAHTLPEHLPRASEILQDILRPALRPQDFIDEKKVIIEEIAMYEDHPFWVLYERAMEVFYRDHPLSHRVLGTRQTISTMRRNQMAAYFDERYAADNTVVAMAGRLDFHAMLESFGAGCDTWTASGAGRAVRESAPAPEEFLMRRPALHRQYTLLLAPAPAIDDERRYAAGMLAQILGESEGSRLYWALVETGIAEEAQAEYHGRDGAGEFLVSLCCAPEDAEQAERLARHEIENLVASLTEDDLARARSKIATDVTLQGELPAGRMQRLGRLWTYLGAYRSLEEELARIDAVTLDDLRAVCEAFPIQPVVTARLAPES